MNNNYLIQATQFPVIEKLHCMIILQLENLLNNEKIFQER